ncbi:beta-N-acetylglucosaminidase domain-containing protein [Paenibacillus sp. GCM10027629]|uniref:beta-N-acetylglucosaminidase domain-containing protein n=1 Tax=Paenibacillus sp. GCM10027629 TaxID=3273414 RepID=UPI0036314DA6
MEIRVRGKINFAMLCILLLIVNMFQANTVSAETTNINLALQKPVFESGHDSSFIKENLVDGNTGTRWASRAGNTPEVYASWIYVDLEQPYRINKIEAALERYPTEYKLMASSDAVQWTEIVAKVREDSANYSSGGTDAFEFATPVTARYVKFQGVRPRLNADGTLNKWGYSLYELRVFQAPLEDSDYVALAKQNVMVPEHVFNNFNLPLSDPNGVSITWTSNSNAIAIDGGSATVTRGEQDQAVTLTAVFSKNHTSDTMNYSVVVRGKVLGQYTFYPKVHNSAYGDGAIQLAGKTIHLVMEEGVSENTAAKAQSIFEKRGFTVTKAGSTDSIDVLIGIDNGKGADEEYLNGKFDPAVSVKKDEGYVLKTSEADLVIAIMGADNSGAFYGVTTLDQILEQADGVLTDVLIEDYADIKFRGFIEGFYGTPWSHENRKDLMAFGGDFKMNSYLYGPKNDPYHAAQWKDPYPADKLAELKELVDKGLATNVEFVWAAHVGGKINLGSEADIQALKNKFDQMYGIGVRQFAIFFDDSATNNDQLVSFITRMDSEYIKPKGDIKPIIFCPQYYRKDSGSQSTINYLQNISKFPKDVQIMWTGDNVVSPIKQSVVDWVTQYIDRPVYIWWNYPVNDLGRAGYVHMGPSKGLNAGVKNISGFASNPMNQAQASKVSLFSVADYTWNTDEYDYEQNWQDSFNYIIRDNPKAAGALRIFSQNASHGLNPFDAGESLYLLPQMNAIKQAFAGGEDISESGASLVRAFEEIIGAVDTLKAYTGTHGISGELMPWLDKMRKIAQASRNAVQQLVEMRKISTDDPASIQAAMQLLSERREELKTAVSAGKVVAQKEIVPFTEEILNLLETQLMETLSLPLKWLGFGSTTADYAKMLDGDMTTAAVTDSGAVVSSGAYFGVNLGKNTHIDNVSIVMDNTRYYKKGTLEASMDNRTWTEVAAFDTSTVSAKGLGINAKFLRYRATDEFTDVNTGSPNRGLSVMEFQVNVEQPATIYTNVPALKDQALTYNGASALLRNVSGIMLNPGDYVGFQFNKLKNAHSLKIDEGLKFLTAEYSADGMNWSAMPWSDPHITAAKYIRVSNASEEAKTFTLAELSVKFGGSPSLSATAQNLSIYEGNVGNMVDRNPSTYLWLKPSSGRYFIFDLGSEIPVYDMLINSDKDLVSSGTIEFSSDGINWRDPITFSNAGSINIVDCGGKLARYLKLTDGVQNKWLKVHEVEINKNVKEDTFVLSGNLSGMEKLLDKDIFSYVDVGNAAGEMTYNNINAPGATNLILMKNEGSEVKLMVKKATQAATDWIDVGKFTGMYQNIDLHAYAPVSELKLKWEKNSGLRLNELYVGGGKVMADKSALHTAIDVAQAKHDAAVEGSAPGEYALGSKKTLQTAIDAAKAVYDNAAATQAQVDDVVTALDTAVATFEANKAVALTDYKAMWGFNGNGNDSSPNGFNATLKGGAAYSQSDKKEGTSSLSLNGSGSYASASLVSTNVDNITLSAWVKWNGATTSGQQILLNGTTSASGYSIFLDHGKGDKVSILLGGKAVLGSQTVLTVGQWTHIAAVRQGGMWKLYMNGSSIEITDSSSAPNTPTTGTYIGSNQSGNESFNGLIDDARIYTAALSANQIKELTSQAEAFTLSLNQPSYSLMIGDTLPTVVTATYSDSGAVKDVTSLAVFTTADGKIASVDNRGVLTGVAEGSTTVSASYGGETVTAQVHVTKRDMQQTAVKLIGPTSVLKGEPFTVRLGLKQVHEPVQAQDVLVQYDPNLYEFQDAVATLEGITVYKQLAQTPGQIRLIIVSLGSDHAITTDAELIELKFVAKQVPQSVSGSIAVTNATIGDAQGHESEALPASVTVEVTADPELPGDVNHDNKYSIADLAIAAAHYGMTQQHPDWNKFKSADMDSNGVIDILDLAAIAKKIIG